MNVFGGVEVIVDFSAFDAIETAVEGVPEQFLAAVAKRVEDTRPAFQQSVRPPDDLPELPFIWSGDPDAQVRARAWWFAHLRELGIYNPSGGRYQRTGAMVKAWDLRHVAEENGGRVEAFNNADGAEYVYGERQVPSHRLTGWGLVTEQLDKQGELLGAGFAEDWFIVSGEL